MNIKENIKTHFKLQGFVLEPKAAAYITDIFTNLDADKCNKVYDKIISAIMEQQLVNNKISLEIIEKTINICRKDNVSIKLFQVIDALNVPKLRYNNDNKKFFLIDDNATTTHFSKLVSDDAIDKTNVTRNRYDVIFQRLARNNLSGIKESLKPIQYLLSCGTILKKVVVLGMLTQFQEGQWYLEDPSGAIQSNLADTRYHKGLVLEGSFVLAEGRYEDKILHVATIGMPPLELPSVSRDAIQNNLNYFGGLPLNGSVKSSLQIEKIANIEMSGKGLVFISEIWLDKESVFQKLKILFHGYTSTKPGAFILCGDFLSPDTISIGPSEKLKLLKQAIRNVIRSFAMFPELALNSHLVFVPGPNDPFQGPRNILPRPSLPSFILDGVFDSFPGFTQSDCLELKARILLASNPCRITYYNKEIVVFRESLVQKLYRHCMYIPSEEDQMKITAATLNDSLNMSTENTITENSEIEPISQDKNQAFFLESQLAWTILSQAHLMPLPMHVSPVYWGLDQSLQLFPAPDLVVLSDPAATAFDMQLNESIVINPANFSTGEHFPFKIYYPFKGEIQSCNLNI